MEPEIGKQYRVDDMYGMLYYMWTYIGKGKVFTKTFTNDFYVEGSKEYYVFEKFGENSGYYKYCVAYPVFRGLEWSGYFQAIEYRNSLEELLSQPKTKFKLI